MNKHGQHHAPPRWSQKLLRIFLRNEYLEEIEGDIDEVFEDFLEHNPVKKASRLYSKEVLKAIRPALIKRLINIEKFSYLSLLLHNLTITLRGFRRHKTTFLINLIGLSTGLSASLLIFLWTNDEMSVDKFHEKDDRLYQVMQHSPRPDGIETDPGTPALLAKALITEMPEVENAVTVNNRGGVGSHGIISAGDQSIETTGTYASSDFFNIFSYPLLVGQPESILNQQADIVLSESLALALFGSTDDIIGKLVKGNRHLMNKDYRVSGIFKDLTRHSTAHFDFVINYETVFANVDWLNDWNADGTNTYITLKEGTNVSEFNQKIKDFLLDKPDREADQLSIQQYSSRYLFGDYVNGSQSGGRIGYVRLMAIVALFILLVACINFMNLSTAQASRKMKQVGVKKVFGVTRKSLVAQFMTEAILTTFIAVMVATLLMSLVLPAMDEITGKQLRQNLSLNLVLMMLAIALVTGLIAGIYPSFYLSQFKPIAILSGKLKSTFGDLWIRKGLVIMQFVISILFISGFMVVSKQIDFLQNADMGYNRDNIIHFVMRNRADQKPFLESLKNTPGVINATYQYGGSIVDLNGSGSGFSWGDPVLNEEIQFRRPHVGYDFIETLGIELLEGRSFSPDFGDESAKLIINEAAAKVIGLEDIVGRTIMDGDEEKQVIGIVKNFKIKSLYEPMEPCIMRFVPQGWDIMVKIESEAQSETINKIEAIYNSFNPEYPLVSTFIEDEHQAVYIAEQRVGTLAKYFTVVAIIISCLGLFGLAAFTAERRIKEIGIRKILGSSVFEIIKLLSSDFSKMVLAAIIIALPLSYILATRWLENFAYGIELKWWSFAIAGASALVIAWITVGFQTFKAAKVNPAKCLRNE
jgi:putative ABC transport system permease protein